MILTGQRLIFTFVAITVIFLGATYFAQHASTVLSTPHSDLDPTASHHAGVLQMKRTVESKLPVETVLSDLHNIHSWTSWFHDGKNVTLLTHDQTPTNLWEQAETLLVQIENPQKQWKRFDLTGKLIHADLDPTLPIQSVTIQINSDSSKKMTALFENIIWKIAVDRDHKTITGEVSATPIGTRGKILAWFTPKILLNQIFYPDIMKLSGHIEKNNPSTVTH